MNRPALECGPSGRGSPTEAERVSCPGILEFWRYPALRSQAKGLAVKPPDDSALRAAEPRRVVDQGLRNRLQVAPGTTDDFQYLTGGRWLLKRFGHLRMGLRERVVLLLQLGEQSYIFDRDNGLIGECLQEGDLAFRKASGCTPSDSDGADRRPVPQH